jgi:hypothetical protein
MCTRLQSLILVDWLAGGQGANQRWRDDQRIQQLFSAKRM